MKKIRNKYATVLGLAFSLFLAVACNNGAGEKENDATDTTSMDNEAMTPMTASAIITGVMDNVTVDGTARFESTADGKVKMMLSLSIPTKANKRVAVHIHENGDCADGGKAAGGHWNPTAEDHGKWGDAHFHSGDIGNIQLDAEGKGSMEMETDRWSIGGGAATNILNHGFIVHGGEDDFKSQPSGNAGDRIGCGVIK